MTVTYIKERNFACKEINIILAKEICKETLKFVKVPKFLCFVYQSNVLMFINVIIIII